MSEDKMTASWIKEMYFEEGEEEFWNKAKEAFVRQRVPERLELLRSVNAWMDQEGDRPTKELASLLTKQRELEDLHRTLKAVGR